MGHRTRVLVSSLSLLPLLVTTTASPAAAQTLPPVPMEDLICPIAATVRVTPGIRLLAQPQQLTGHVQGGTAVSPLTPCTSLTGVPYQGFTMELTGTGAMACGIAALEGGLSGTAHVTWDNGDTSTASWSVTTVAMVPVVNVTVTDGALASASVVVGGVPTSLTGNCPLNPIIGVGFGGVAEFLRTGG
jgi:hypothetical protein